jgi:hypothetical protein
MNLQYLCNLMPVLTMCTVLTLQILLIVITRLRTNSPAEDKPKLQFYPNFFPGTNSSLLATVFPLASQKPEPNLLERALVCAFSAVSSGIMLFVFWQHTELFTNLVHVSNQNLINRSLADVIASVAFMLPIIFIQYVFHYHRQRKVSWQSLLLSKNVLHDTLMVGSSLFWFLPFLLLIFANGLDADTTISVSRCVLMCTELSLFTMACACLITATKSRNLLGIDILTLKKYCLFLEDDNFSCIALDTMSTAQLLDLTTVAVKTGDLEKADIISSYYLASVDATLAPIL